jgi:hypothetical protein
MSAPTNVIWATIYNDNGTPIALVLVDSDAGTILGTANREHLFLSADPTADPMFSIKVRNDLFQDGASAQAALLALVAPNATVLPPLSPAVMPGLSPAVMPGR